MKPDIYDAIHAANMSQRPAFYAGRGPNTSDCSSDHLVKIHAFLRAQDPKAARAMVAVIADLKEMGASEVLSALFALAGNDYKMPRNPRQPTQTEAIADGMKDPATGDYNADRLGLCGMFDFMSDRRSPEQLEAEGDQIKREFFRALNKNDLPIVAKKFLEKESTARMWDYGYGYGVNVYRGGR